MIVKDSSPYSKNFIRIEDDHNNLIEEGILYFQTMMQEKMIDG